MPTSDDIGDIALIPTILSALSHSTDGKIKISKRDHRIKVKRKKISTHTLIILDVSSSMMEGSKLMVAKKCLDEIFLDTYQKRDRIAVITAGGEQADYLLPFTSNIEKGRELIDSIGFGGTTPLSSGLRSGIRVLEDIMRKEPWMVPIMVIITDGGANVPLSMGGSIQDEFSRLSSEMDYVNIRPLVINVGDDSALCEEMVWKTDGRYLSLTVEDEYISSDLELEKEVEDILHGILLSFVGSNTTCLSYDGYSMEALSKVKEILEDHPIKIEVNEDCHYGCSPHDDPSDLCRECLLKVNEDMNTISRAAGIGYVSEHQNEKDLRGELFVRYLVQPGTLMKAHNGILFVEDEAAYDKFSDLIETGINKGECNASNAEYTESYPFRPHGVIVRRDQDYIDLDDKFHVRYKDVVEEKLWMVNAERDSKTDHTKFMEELGSSRLEKIDIINGLIAGDIYVNVPDYINDLLRNAVDPDQINNIIGLAKASAALKGKDKANLEDLADALKQTDISMAIDESNSHQYLFSKLAFSLAAKDEIKLSLVDGYTYDEFSDAIDIISELPITIETLPECSNNCHPKSDDLCPECRIRWDDKDPETVEIPLPLVRIKGNESLQQLRGELFVKYVLTSDTLLKANRGLLVIESIKDMDTDTIAFLKELLTTGKFTVRNEEHSQSFHVDLSVIALKDSNRYNDLIDHSIGHVITKEDYEDILPPIFGGDRGDQFIERTLERIEETRSNETELSDELLDYIIRVCMELGINRYDAEIKIERLAKAMSVWNGSEVTNEVINKSISTLAPLMGEGMRDNIR